MKNIIVTLIIAAVVVFAMYLWNESVKRKYAMDAEYEMTLNDLAKTIDGLNTMDSLLRCQVLSRDSNIVITRDSIKMYKNKLLITKKNYETRIANMFYWTDSEHIRFFSIETDSVK
jgi:hypothetical protein